MIEHVNISEERLSKLKRIRNWATQLKDFLGVDVRIEDEVMIEGDPLQVIRAKEIIKAFGRGFTFNQSLDLLDETHYLNVMEISNIVGKSSNRVTVMKGRLIGKAGETKKMIEKTTGAKVAVHGKTVSIIGTSENIKVARAAIEIILSGSKHNSVYRFLQDHRVV